MKVAIMGFGVVGSGVAEVISGNCEVIEKNSNVSLELSHILDIRDFENNPFSSFMTKNFEDILNDDETEIVVETMGGVNPAFTFVSMCLEKGKHVFSSNKELVATRGFELLTLARENNVNFLFEASVGGGIPIIRPISRCLAGNRISEVAGILNGTSNFILTKMIVDGMSFDEALSLAQQKGYAEKDPTADVEGHDACRKVCILATLAFGKHVYPEQVKTEGITNITLEDVASADSFGCVIKLIGHAEKLENGKITASVRPTVVSRQSMLSGVNGVFNAVLINGDQTGEVMFYGKGAGKEATASAVVADIMDCAKHVKAAKYLNWEDGYEGYVDNNSDQSESIFVKIKSDNYENLVNLFEENFSGLTLQFTKNEFSKEICFITKPIKNSLLTEKLNNFPNCEIKTLHTIL